MKRKVAFLHFEDVDIRVGISNNPIIFKEERRLIIVYGPMNSSMSRQ